MVLRKQNIAVILLYILIFSVFVNSELYLVSKQLFAFRLALPVCLFTLILMGTKVNRHLYPFLQIFFVYTVYTLGLTFIYPSYAEAGDILNFILLFLYVFVLVLFLSEYKEDFKRVLANLSIVFIVLYLCFAFYEIFTGNHFPVSAMNEFEDVRTNMPSVVYVNPNDFCMVLTLMICYCFTYFKNRKVIIILSILLIPIAFVTFIAGARLNLLLIGLFLLFLGVRSIKGLVLLGFASVFVLWGVFYFNDIGMSMDDYQFADESTSVRLSLYHHALNSVKQSGGLGFGVNTGQEYYQKINDASLDWIIDPHGYVFEILINSGLIFFFVFIIASAWIMFRLYTKRKYVIAIFYIVYFLVLFSSSSSIFQMAHYLFFCYMVSEAAEKTIKLKLT